MTSQSERLRRANALREAPARGENTARITAEALAREELAASLRGAFADVHCICWQDGARCCYCDAAGNPDVELAWPSPSADVCPAWRRRLPVDSPERAALLAHGCELDTKITGLQLELRRAQPVPIPDRVKKAAEGECS